MDVGPVDVAMTVRQALEGRPGFPRTRIRLVSPPGRPNRRWIVEWGGAALPSPITDGDRARFYGATDTCIAEAEAAEERRAALERHLSALTPSVP